MSLLVPSLGEAQSSLWKVQTKNHLDYLVRNKTQKFELPASNTSPKIKQVKIHGNYEVVIYLADVSGTTQMFEVYNGAVYSRKDKKILEFLPYRYDNTDPKGDDGDQPQWKFLKNGSIEYRSVDFPDSPRLFAAPKR